MRQQDPPRPTPVSINPLVAEFAVLDWRKSLNFYTKLLGFQVVFERPEEGFVFVQNGQAQLMFYQANLERSLVIDDMPLTPPLGRGVNLQIQVESVAPMVRTLKEADVPLALAVEERRYEIGEASIFVRQFAVVDPDGYLLRFSERIR